MATERDRFQQQQGLEEAPKEQAPQASLLLPQRRAELHRPVSAFPSTPQVADQDSLGDTPAQVHRGSILGERDLGIRHPFSPHNNPATK